MLFFFNDTATTEIYTLSLHDALPIYSRPRRRQRDRPQTAETGKETGGTPRPLWGTKPAKRRSQRSRTRPPVGGWRRNSQRKSCREKAARGRDSSSRGGRERCCPSATAQIGRAHV